MIRPENGKPDSGKCLAIAQIPSHGAYWRSVSCCGRLGTVDAACPRMRIVAFTVGQADPLQEECEAKDCPATRPYWDLCENR
jgi:hypothetical protein